MNFEWVWISISRWEFLISSNQIQLVYLFLWNRKIWEKKEKVGENNENVRIQIISQRYL